MSASAETLPSSLSTAGYSDGLGRRSIRFDREIGGMLECLAVRPELGLYEGLVRSAAAAVSAMDDERVAPVRAVQRERSGVLVLSDLVAGQRLSDLLDGWAADEGAPGIDVALGFLVQALGAVGRLHAAGLVHGTLAPGRVLLTPTGQIVLADCIYGAAIERAGFSRERLWTSFGLAVPEAPGPVRFDAAADVRQLGLLALALAIGRAVERACERAQLAAAVHEVSEIAQIRAGDAFAADLRAFFAAAVGIGDRLDTAEEAGRRAAALAGVLGSDGCLTALVDLARVRPLPDLTTAHVISAFHLHGPVETETELGDPAASGFDFEPDPGDFVANAGHTPLARADATGQPPGLSPEAESADVSAVANDESFDFRHAPEAAQEAEAAPLESHRAWSAAATSSSSPSSGTPSLEQPPAWSAAATAEGLHSPADALMPAVPFCVAQEPLPGTALPGPVHQPAIAPPSLAAPVGSHAAPTPVVPPAAIPAAPIAPIGPMAAAPVHVAPVAPAPVTPTSLLPVAESRALRLKTDEPEGYARPRRLLTDIPPNDAPRALPFVDRSASQPQGRGVWKLAVAAAVVLTAGGFAARPYIGGAAQMPIAAQAAEAAPAPPRGLVGSIQIETQPAGAAVLLDGEDVGRTPLTLDAVKPGRHVLTLSTETATVKRTVRVEAGKVVTLDVPVYSGWIAVYSPVPLHVSEGGRTVGTTDSPRIMLSPGRHTLTFTNTELGYRSEQSVEVTPGRERVLNLQPKGAVNVNALPWAEVWVDGTRMGETPLANLEVPLGSREFVFRHPTHGERRITTTVTARTPPISVDFTKPGGLPTP